MNKEWREYIKNRCCRVLYDNEEYRENEAKANDPRLLNQTALELCFVAGMEDAIKLFSLSEIKLNNEEIEDECKRALIENNEYNDMYNKEVDEDLIQAEAETICYKMGFVKAVKTEPH